MNSVVITVVGTQYDAQGEESRIELITAGQYYEKKGVQYIIYKDSEISGLEGVTTMLKVYEKHMILVRTGTIEYKQEFRLGEKNYSTYITPYMTMGMGIFTQHIDVALQGANGHIQVEYDLEINGQWQSKNTLSISVREEMKSGH